MWFYKLMLLYSPPIAPAIVAAGIGAGMDLLGGMMGNSSSAEQARKARHSMEYMNTHKRQLDVVDLRDAGLNPMLAAMSSGAMPSPPIAHMQNPMPNAGKIVSNALINDATVQNLASNSAKNIADADKAKAEAGLATAQQAEAEARTGTYGPTIERTNAETQKLKFELPNLLETFNLTHAQTAKVYNEISLINKQGTLTEAHTKEALARAGLTSAQIAEIQPRIDKLLAETESIKAVQPFQRLKGDYAEIANIPRLMSNSAGSISQDLIDKLYDLFNPSSSAKAARDPRNNSPAYNSKHFPNYNRR